MTQVHIGNLQCNVSHVPPNAYSVTSHTGLVELLSPSYGQPMGLRLIIAYKANAAAN